MVSVHSRPKKKIAAFLSKNWKSKNAKNQLLQIENLVNSIKLTKRKLFARAARANREKEVILGQRSILFAFHCP